MTGTESKARATDVDVDGVVVAHVPRRLSSQSWGGTERVLQETLPRLRAHGYHPIIHTTSALEATSVGTLAGVNVTRHAYFYPEWPLSKERKLLYDQKGGNLVSLSLARALAETRGLGLVHLHTGNRLGAQCVRVAEQRGVPSVITLHGGHFDIPPEEQQNLRYEGGTDPRRGLDWGKVLSAAWGTRALLHNVNAVICVGVAEYEAARAALPEQRVVFLPGGVDVAAFSRGDRAAGRALLGVASGRQLVLCAARVDRQKAQDTLVSAWMKIQNGNCDLALVGPETSPGYAKELQALAQGSGGKLIVFGSVAPEDMPHVYAAADICVLPSRHEPFGLACLEAWAARTCFVASNVGGPGWLLQGEREGRLFKAGDSEALAALLERLLRSPGEREQLAAAGYERAESEFSWDLRAARLCGLYDEVRAAHVRRGRRIGLVGLWR